MLTGPDYFPPVVPRRVQTGLRLDRRADRLDEFRRRVSEAAPTIIGAVLGTTIAVCIVAIVVMARAILRG